MRLIFLGAIIMLTACQPFSKNEKVVLDNTACLLGIVDEMRTKEVSNLEFKMDYLIWEEGNKDTFLIKSRDSVLDIAEQLVMDHQYYIKKNKIDNFLKRHNSRLQTPLTKFDHHEKLDSVLIKSFFVFLKDDIVNYYVMYLGTYDLKYTPLKPYINENSNLIEQGQEYRANFFIGSPAHAQFFGKGKVDGDKICSMPDSQIGKAVWKGKLIHFRDTIDVEIPYEIIDCP